VAGVPVVAVRARELRADFEAVFDRLARGGDLVWVAAGEQRFLLVNEPELVAEVLVRRSTDLAKPRSQALDLRPPRAEAPAAVDIAALRRAVSHGLGDRGAAAVTAVRAAAAAETASWRDGAEVELMPLLRRIGIAAAVRGAFASELAADDVRRLDRVLRWFDEAPRVLPGRRLSRYSLRRRLMEQELRHVGEALVAGADRSVPSELDGLAVGDVDTLPGELLLGAVGPLVQSAAWLVVRFAAERAEAGRLRAEWPATGRTEAFVREVTRLHPTNPRITRTALVDTVVGGEPVPARARVVLNVNAISRDERFFDEPERLLPDRWLTGRPHKFAYLSFGIGERRCLGEAVAVASLTALLPALADGWELRTVGLGETAAGRRQPAEGTRLAVSVC
jgi:cytochrome P450